VLPGLAGYATAQGLEANVNQEPRVLGADEVHATADFGSRTYVTVNGEVSLSYVEAYEDTNDNGSQDANESGREWFSFLVDPATTIVTSETTTWTGHFRSSVMRSPEARTSAVARSSRMMSRQFHPMIDAYWTKIANHEPRKPKIGLLAATVSMPYLTLTGMAAVWIAETSRLIPSLGAFVARIAVDEFQPFREEPLQLLLIRSSHRSSFRYPGLRWSAACCRVEPGALRARSAEPSALPGDMPLRAALRSQNPRNQ